MNEEAGELAQRVRFEPTFAWLSRMLYHWTE
jgi:hypothetical protein